MFLELPGQAGTRITQIVVQYLPGVCAKNGQRRMRFLDSTAKGQADKQAKHHIGCMRKPGHRTLRLHQGFIIAPGTVEKIDQVGPKCRLVRRQCNTTLHAINRLRPLPQLTGPNGQIV